MRMQAQPFRSNAWLPRSWTVPPEVEDLLSPSYFRKVPIPWEAAFLAGKCFLEYRKRGGRKRSPLPDFFIGAHASILGIPLMTRDVSRYRTNYPKLELVAPQ